MVAALLALCFVALAAADLAECRSALLADAARDVLSSGLPGAIGKPDECVLDPAAHYCLMFLGLRNTSVPWGICVPRNCSFAVVRTFLDDALKPLGGSVQSGRCGWSDAGWTGGAIATVVVLSLLAAVGFVVTVMLHCAPRPAQRVEAEKQLLLDPINDQESEKRQAKPPAHVLLRGCPIELYRINAYLRMLPRFDVPNYDYLASEMYSAIQAAELTTQVSYT